jgi:hypothetical protein
MDGADDKFSIAEVERLLFITTFIATCQSTIRCDLDYLYTTHTIP